MVETTFFDASLTTAVASGAAMIAFCFVQPAWLAGCWLTIAPATVGVPVGYLAPDR
jgi:hypothetical protein